MTFDTFAKAVNQLCKYYERKEPQEETLVLWHKDVADIPDNAVPKIVSWLRREHESFPRNVPLAMRRGYETVTPDGRPEREPEKFCYHCTSTGYIFTRQDGYRYAYRCHFCRQAPELGIPFYEPGKTAGSVIPYPR